MSGESMSKKKEETTNPLTILVLTGLDFKDKSEQERMAMFIDWCFNKNDQSETYLREYVAEIVVREIDPDEVAMYGYDEDGVEAWSSEQLMDYLDHTIDWTDDETLAEVLKDEFQFAFRG